MVFNSLEYAIFLPIVLGLYWLLSHRKQNLLLLAASYVFYGAWDVRFLGLMIISTLTDFTVGRLLERTEDDRRRKRIFMISLVVNLGILGFFKYANFFTASAARLLKGFGLQPHLPVLHILLPIGISFYTFHGISYTFDVYRRQIRATDNLLNFACFVSFFPQLVAGPIGRAHIQLPQFENPRKKPPPEDVRSALFLILLGLFKKVAIADGLAPFVASSFGAASHAGWPSLLVGMYAFAFQIYGDFSGYSDIARGSARLFGIELIKNFDQPYLSRNITEFWRTWHISLSSWLRDYLYVPVGGNRGSSLATYRNIMITMLLGGLWHGARWTFVVWGGLHGAYLVGHRLFMGRRARARADEQPIGRPLGPRGRVREEGPPRLHWSDIVPAVLTFHLVCLAWIFFRAQTFGEAFHYIGGIVTLRSGGHLDPNAVWTLAFAAIAIIGIDLVQRQANSETPVLGWHPIARGLVYGSLLIPVILFTGGVAVPFIYFQF